MKKLFTLLIITLAISPVLFAQQKSSGTVKGRLIDSVSHQNLKDATVSVLNNEDSSLVVYGLSKADGSFLIENVPFGSYIFQISFQGYGEIEKKFSISSSNPDYNPGNLYLAPLPTNLGTVTVKSSVVAVKGDTTEFNAALIKTKPNSTAEDLIKKLPGVEVDKEGAIKAQGQNVTRVLVDGKRFFGDDAKMATRNLPTDVIDKIQVIDAQSDQSAFSGFDDGNREKVVNIVTKKDRRKGVFGKGTAGVGDEGLYANNVNINAFNGNRGISLTGQANNINAQNFTMQDFLGARGGGGNRGGGGGGNQSGISRTFAGGLSYNDDWGTKTTANGSYFYNNVKNSNNSDRFRETFVKNDSSLFNATSSVSGNSNQNHRFSFEVEHKFDTMNSLLIRPTFGYQETDYNSQTKTLTTRGKLVPLNNINSVSNSANSGYNFNNTILYRHKFAKRGRTISLNLTQSLNTNNRTANNFSVNSLKADTVNQQSNTDRDGKNFGANISYTEPVSDKGQVELNYNFNYNQNNSDQKTFNFNNVTGKYDLAGLHLTNLFENTNTSSRIGVNYRRQISKEWNYSLGMGVQHAQLTSNNISKKTYLSQSFNNLFPNFSLQYSQSRTKNLRFFYRGSTNQPGISQLQDVLDKTSNVLNHTIGNPSLKQEFTNNFNLTYTNFNPFTFRNFLVSLNGGMVSNRISTYTIVNSTSDSIILYEENDTLGSGAQFSKPINLDGGFNVSGFINYGFPLKNPKSNINLTTRLSLNETASLSKTLTNANPKAEDLKLFTNSYTVGETVRWTMNLNERFDLNFFSTSTYNFVRYSSNAGSKQNGDYFSQAFSAEPTFSTKNGWILASDFDYTFYRGQSAGYNQSIPLWNASLSKMMFKNKRGELKLSVLDLLNQNKSITRNVQDRYIEDVRTHVLTRYFLLSFTYNLRSFKGGSQNNRMNMFRGPGPGGDGEMRQFRMRSGGGGRD